MTSLFERDGTPWDSVARLQSVPVGANGFQLASDGVESLPFAREIDQVAARPAADEGYWC